MPPICSLCVGTGVGALSALLGSKMCRLGIGATDVSLRNNRHPNSPIGRRIGSTGGDALISTSKLVICSLLPVVM
jgi:hypothetical protein